MVNEPTSSTKEIIFISCSMGEQFILQELEIPIEEEE